MPKKPTITCPYCHSTNTKKISGLSKAAGIAAFGVFALGRSTKQWHCNNCKSDF
jgi:transposase-like protein